MKGIAAAMLLAASAAVAACPSDTTTRAAETLLVVQQPGVPPLVLGASDLGALPATALTHRQMVSSGAGNTAERSTVFAGVLVRDVLAKAAFGGPTDRGARMAVVEAVATDGYRALFSWGELFNTGVGEQALVLMSQDGRPLDAVSGPLALRSLADLRSGPRHVRNLCALIVRR